MRANNITVRWIAVFNILTGSLTATCSGLLVLFGVFLDGGTWHWENVIAATLPAAAGLQAFWGLSFLAEPHCPRKQSTAILALSVCCGLVFILGMLLPAWIEQLQEGEIYNEGMIAFTLVPTSLVLVAIGELVYFSRWTDEQPV